MPAVGYLDEARVNNRKKDHGLLITDVTQVLKACHEVTKAQIKTTLFNRQYKMSFPYKVFVS